MQRTVAVCLGSVATTGLLFTVPSAANAASTLDSAGVSAATAAPVYRFLATQQVGGRTVPVRWNPCNALTWSWVGAGPVQRQIMAAAFTQLSVATGIQIRQVASGAKVQIAYRRLPGTALGAADVGWSAIGTNREWFRTARISIDTDTTLPRFRNVDRLGIYLHEAGHAMGLSHVNSRQEIMYPQFHGQRTLGAGDRAGLRLLGRSQGCAG